MIILKRNVTALRAMVLIEKHNIEQHAGQLMTCFHRGDYDPTATERLYDVYCPECDPLPKTDEKGE